MYPEYAEGSGGVLVEAVSMGRVGQMIEKFEQRRLLTNVNGQEKVGTGGGRQPRSRRCHLTPENLTRCLHSIQTTAPLPSLLYSTSFYFSHPLILIVFS